MDYTAYGVTVAFAFMVFVVCWEEPRLGDFPDEYRAYFDNVQRWLPRISPWRF